MSDLYSEPTIESDGPRSFDEAMATVHQLRRELAAANQRAEESDALILKLTNDNQRLRTLLTAEQEANARATRCEVEEMADREIAESYADRLASVILNEPIDWPCHEAKWKEALEQNAALSDLRQMLSKLHAVQHFGEWIVKPTGGESVIGWAIAEIQAAQVAVAHGKLILESIDRYLEATAHVTGIERERKELIANANHFSASIAGEVGAP